MISQSVAATAKLTTTSIGASVKANSTHATITQTQPNIPITMQIRERLINFIYQFPSFISAYIFPIDKALIYPPLVYLESFMLAFKTYMSGKRQKVTRKRKLS